MEGNPATMTWRRRAAIALGRLRRRLPGVAALIESAHPALNGEGYFRADLDPDDPRFENLAYVCLGLIDGEADED